MLLAAALVVESVRLIVLPLASSRGRWRASGGRSGTPQSTHTRTRSVPSLSLGFILTPPVPNDAPLLCSSRKWVAMTTCGRCFTCWWSSPLDSYHGERSKIRCVVKLSPRQFSCLVGEKNVPTLSCRYINMAPRFVNPCVEYQRSMPCDAKYGVNVSPC